MTNPEGGASAEELPTNLNLLSDVQAPLYQLIAAENPEAVLMQEKVQALKAKRLREISKENPLIWGNLDHIRFMLEGRTSGPYVPRPKGCADAFLLGGALSYTALDIHLSSLGTTMPTLQWEAYERYGLKLPPPFRTDHALVIERILEAGKAELLRNPMLTIIAEEYKKYIPTSASMEYFRAGMGYTSYLVFVADAQQRLEAGERELQQLDIDPDRDLDEGIRRILNKD